MKRSARQSSSSKRERKVGTLSESGGDVSPLYKKPKHHRRSSLDTENTNVKTLKSIRKCVGGLQSLEENFHQDQQNRYEDIQSHARDFYWTQQDRYKKLMVWISDTELRWSKEEMDRKIKQEDKDVFLELKNRVMETCAPNPRDIHMGDRDAVDGVTLTPPTRASLLLSLTTNHRDLSPHPSSPKGIYLSENEAEPSLGETENGLPHFTALKNRKQAIRDSSPINNIGGQISQQTIPYKPAKNHPHNKPARRGSSLGFCIDSSDGDDGNEDYGPPKDFQEGILTQNEGIFNEDGAIEGMKIGLGFSGLEVEDGHYSPSATLSSGQDQAQPSPTIQKISASDETKDSSTRRHPRRELPSTNYKEYLYIGDSDEPSSTPSNEAHTKTRTRAPSKTRAKKTPIKNPTNLLAKTPAKTPAKMPAKMPGKTPGKRKLPKAEHIPESDYGSYNPSPVKDGTSRKKSTNKLSAGKMFGAMDKFVIKREPTEKPTLASAAGLEGKNCQPPDSSNSDGKPEPVLVDKSLTSVPKTLQLEADLSTETLLKAPGVPLNKPTVSFPRSYENKNSIGQYSGAAAAAANFRAVRTSPIS